MLPSNHSYNRMKHFQKHPMHSGTSRYDMPFGNHPRCSCLILPLHSEELFLKINHATTVVFFLQMPPCL